MAAQIKNTGHKYKPVNGKLGVYYYIEFDEPEENKDNIQHPETGEELVYVPSQLTQGMSEEDRIKFYKNIDHSTSVQDVLVYGNTVTKQLRREKVMREAAKTPGYTTLSDYESKFNKNVNK